MPRHILAGVDLIASNITVWLKGIVNNSDAILREENRLIAVVSTLPLLYMGSTRNSLLSLLLILIYEGVKKG